jgi:hypothetical protein
MMEDPDDGSQATNNALMSGGIAAMQAATPQGGGSLGAAIGAGLASGTATFVATKDAEKDKAARIAAQDRYRSYIEALPLDPKAKAGLIGMGVEAGSKMLAEAGLKTPEFTTNVIDDGGRKTVVATNKADGTTRSVYQGAPEPVKPTLAEADKGTSAMAYELFGQADLAKLTPEQRKEAGDKARAADLAKAQAGRSTVNVTTNLPPGEPEWFRGLATKESDRFAEQRVEALKAPEAIASIDRALASLPESFTGLGAGAKLNVLRAVSAVIPGFDSKKISSSEGLRRELENQVLPRIKLLGPPVSDADVEMARGTIAKITDNTRSINDALEVLRGIYGKAITGHDEQLNRIKAGAEGRYLPPTMTTIGVPPRPDKVTYVAGKPVVAKWDTEQNAYFIEDPAKPGTYKRVR